MDTLPDAIGIMADSHGHNDLLLRAIAALRSAGAETLFHLGDLCDTLAPGFMNEAFRILAEHQVRAVRGNNECQILHDLHSARTGKSSRKTLSLLEGLPYTLTLGSFWFTHSAPYDFPAATRRPISEFMPVLVNDPGIPFSVLFRGHSHRPSILEIKDGESRKVPLETDRDIPLDRGLRYVITVGAVENASSVLFLPGEYRVRFMSVPRQ